MNKEIKFFFYRRLMEVDELLVKRMYVVFEEHQCDIDFDDFVEFVISDVDMEYEWLFGGDISEDDIEEIPYLINQYIRKYKIKELSSFYSEKCSDN